MCMCNVSWEVYHGRWIDRFDRDTFWVYSLSAPYSGLKDFLSLKFLKILILFPSLIAYLNENKDK